MAYYSKRPKKRGFETVLFQNVFHLLTLTHKEGWVGVATEVILVSDDVSMGIQYKVCSQDTIENHQLAAYHGMYSRFTL